MWNKIKSAIGRLPYKYVIYLCILSLMGIMLIAFAAYIYLDYQEQRQEAAGREADNSVARIVSQVDERLDNLKQYYISFVDSDDFKWVLENELHYSDYKESKAALEIMAGEKIFMDYIGSYYLTNFRTGWVLGSTGIFPLNEVANSEALYELADRNRGVLDKNYWLYNEMTEIERVKNYAYQVSVRKDGISLVMCFSNLLSDPNALFVANLNMNTWKKWISQMLGSSEELVVLDSRGEPVYSTDERLTESCRELRDGGSLAGRSRKVKLGGVSDYMISAGQSDVLGWEYYICYDMNRGQYAGAKLSGVILLSILIIVATCFFMTSYTIYRPVGRLVQGVSEVEQKIDGNELQFLASRFADMKNDRQLLEAMMYQQKEKLLELFELRLIRGEVRTEDEWSEYFEGAGPCSPCLDYFSV